MTRRIEINPGELFAVSDRVILVEEYESVLGMTGKLGTSDNDQIAYLLTFTGKLNNHDDEQGSVTVAIDPQDAFELAGNLLHGIELLINARDDR